MRRSAVLICLLLFSTAIFLPSKVLAINVPEKLEYQILWNGIHAGSSSLSIYRENGMFKIVSNAKSSDMISLFYEVNDNAVSVCQNDTFLPVNYRLKVKEGSTKKDKEVQFGLKDQKALYIDHKKNERKECEIPERVFDPLASLYYLRTLPLEVGKSVFVKVFDSKRVWDVEVQVLKKERVETWLGTFNAILVKPLMKSEGIFNRKGDMYIWLSDDEKRIPVLLKTEVAVGSVKAVLRKIN